MKKIYFILLFTGIVGTTIAQTKSSGVVTLSANATYPMTLKVDVNNTTNLVTFTMTGSTTKWVGFALNATSMSNTNKDCIEYGTALLDRHLSGSQSQPVTDASNDLTLVSSTQSGTTRTVVFTRPLTTTDTTYDYQFTYATLASINIIWAVGPSTAVSSQHSTYGSKTLTFTVLGEDQFTPTLDKLIVSPNPSNGIFTISKSDLIHISKISVYNTTAKLIKEINVDVTNQNDSVDLTGLSKGIYFMEISNETDKVVKKIEIN